MAARLAVGVDAQERLRRLAVVFAVGLRLKIAAELYMREMSAQQFFREFGGGSLSRVSQNFSRLAKEGWLRYLYSKGPGGTRHGGVEHFYRATEPPYFDAPSWALLPYSVRSTSSLSMFRQIAPELLCDLEASLATDSAGQLHPVSIVLDETGWRRTIEAVSAHFTHLYEEQEDARRRAEQSGEKLIRADVLLAAFQMSNGGERPAMSDLLVECPREPLVPFPERLAPLLADEVRRDMVSELHLAELSASQFHREFGGASKAGIGRRFKGLEGGSWVVKGKSLTGGHRRGATEQFYRATRPAVLEFDPFAASTGSMVKAPEWESFEYLCEAIKDAMVAGTFDAKDDRFFSWSMLRFDRQGWANILAQLALLPKVIAAEAHSAKQRISQTGETPISVMLGVAGLEAPTDPIKAL